MKKAILVSLTAVVLMGVAAHQVQAATTIARWRLNEGSGTTVSDEAGNLPATASVDTMWASPGTSPNGGSGSMQGDGSGYVVSDSNLSGASDWSVWGPGNTIEFSIFYPGVVNMPGGTRYLMGAFDGGNSNGLYITHNGVFTSHHIAMFLRTNGSNTIQDIDLPAMETDGLVQPNTWLNVALVNVSGNMKAYVNQQLLSSTYSTPTDGLTAANSIAEQIAFLGRWTAGAIVAGRTTLQMDEVRISSGEVAFEDLLQYPEPGTLGLVMIGGLMILKRRRQR